MNLTLYINGAAAMRLMEVMNMAIIHPVGVVKTKHGTYALHFYNPDGRRRRLSAGRDYMHAQRLAVKFTDWLLEGKCPENELRKAKETAQRKSITLHDFFPLFMKRHGSSRQPQTRQSYTNSFKNISRCTVLVTTALGSITKGLVLDYMNARKDEGVSSATVNREKALLSCMLARALEWEVIDRNPLQGMKSFKEPEKRDVDISVDQMADLITALPHPVARIVEFACYTGFRRENILSLRIERIRFHDLTKTGEVYQEVKGDRKILFPLGERAVHVVKESIGTRKAGYVFLNPQSGTRYVSIKTAFDRAVKQTGLTAVDGSKLRFHDLRHIFSNWLTRNGEGATLDQLRPLLGHKDRATTDRYVTVNYRAAGKILSLLPDIRKTGRRREAMS